MKYAGVLRANNRLAKQREVWKDTPVATKVTRQQKRYIARAKAETLEILINAFS